MNQKLIIFIKHPEAGKVKTRLAAAIGNERAALVYKNLAEDTVHSIRSLAGSAADIIIAYDPPERAADIRRWLAGPYEFMPQGEGALGERLSRAVEKAFQNGAKQVVVIGSDAADLDASTVERAFLALSENEAVLGPSEDGGYYLIGLTRSGQLFLFDGIPWSTTKVLDVTLEKMRRAGISHALLPKKFDVDTIEDLRRLEKQKGGIIRHGQKISVIIPALNEEENMESLLTDLKNRHKPDEIIVADGGSIDHSVAIALKHAKVVQAAKGRASQMNAGASAATGDIFVFLHADTRLPDHAMDRIRAALTGAEKEMGRFRIGFGHPHPLLKLSEFQTRFHFFSYGDQAFFMTKAFFLRLGGFDVQAPFEDVDFYRRALRIARPVILPDRVLTSPRRFLEKGPLRQKMINMTLSLMYYLGCKTEWIRYCHGKWYVK